LTSYGSAIELLSMAAPLSILVVDDEANIRKTLSVCLESDGHRVAAVGNAQDAVAENSRRSFDLAFVDLRLGASSGLDLIPALLASSPWLKIIVITAYASIDTAVEAMRRGAADYIPKPFTPAQVTLAGDGGIKLPRSQQRNVAPSRLPPRGTIEPELVRRLRPDSVRGAHGHRRPHPANSFRDPDARQTARGDGLHL
jgi:DNA-binding NtrC family response regulator